MQPYLPVLMAKILLKQDLSSSGQRMSPFSVPTLAHLLTPCSVTEAFRYDNNTNTSQAKYPIRVNGGNKEKTQNVALRIFQHV